MSTSSVAAVIAVFVGLGVTLWGLEALARRLYRHWSDLDGKKAARLTIRWRLLGLSVCEVATVASTAAMIAAMSLSGEPWALAWSFGICLATILGWVAYLSMLASWGTVRDDERAFLQRCDTLAQRQEQL